MLSVSVRRLCSQPRLLSRGASIRTLLLYTNPRVSLTTCRYNSTGPQDDKSLLGTEAHLKQQGITHPHVDDVMSNINQMSEQVSQEDRIDNITFELPTDSEQVLSNESTVNEEILYDPNEGKPADEIDYYQEGQESLFENDQYLLPDEEENSNDSPFKFSEEQQQEEGVESKSISEDLFELATMNFANQHNIKREEQTDSAEDAFGSLFIDNQGIDNLTDEIILTAKDSGMTKHKTLYENVSEQLDPLFSPYNNTTLDSLDLDRAMDSLLVFKKTLSDEEAFNLMDGMRPVQSKVSPSRYQQLLNDIQHFFSREQITQYIRLNFPGATIKAKASKNKLVKELIGKHWGVKKSSKITDTDLIVESKIKLHSSREMFLVLSSKGHFLNYWSRLGAQLFLNIEESELVVRGTADMVNFVEVSWSFLLSRVHTVELQLDGLLKVKNDNLGNNNLIVKEFPMSKFNVSSNVYYNKISDSDQLYLLSYFKPKDLKKMKSQILNYVNYFPHINNNKVLDISFVDESNCRANNLMSHDVTVPWFDNVTGSFHRFESKKPRLKKSSVDEFDLYADVEFPKDKLIETNDYLTEYTESRQSLQYLINETLVLKDEFNRAQDVFELNNLKMGSNDNNGLKSYNIPGAAFDDRLTPYSTFESEYPESLLLKEAFENENGVKDQLYDNENVSKIYENLSKDNSKDEDIVHGKEIGEWIPKAYSVSYGKVIFNENHDIFASETDLNNNYFFHSDLKEVNSRLGQLELFDKDVKFIGATGDIRNAFRRFIQVTLIPDGFKDLDKFKTHPKIELWFDVIGNRIKNEHPMCFVIENENSYHLPIPTFKHDMKFQCSSNSYLFSDTDSEYYIKQQQPNIYELIQNIPSIPLSNPTNILEAHDYFINHEYQINIGGSTVDYCVGSVNARRSIELKFQDNTVIYDIHRDIGNLENTTKYEVSLLGNVETVEDFEEFYQSSLDFLKFLD